MLLWSVAISREYCSGSVKLDAQWKTWSDHARRFWPTTLAVAHGVSKHAIILLSPNTGLTTKPNSRKWETQYPIRLDSYLFRIVLSIIRSWRAPNLGVVSVSMRQYRQA